VTRSSSPIVAYGRFGLLAAAHARNLAAEEPSGLPPQMPAAARLGTVVIQHGERRTALLAHDRQAFATNTALLPIVLEARWLRAGPVIAPAAAGPCYACFAARRAQRQAEDEVTQALHAQLEATRARHGFLPMHVELAAVIALAFLNDHDQQLEFAAGSVRRYSLDRLAIEVGLVFGLPGCPKCGERRRALQAGAFAAEIRRRVRLPA